MPRGSHHSSKTHCINGHEFTPENTIMLMANYRTTVSRRCRACRKELKRKSRLAGNPHPMAAWRKKNPAKSKEFRAAHDAVSYARRVGKIAKPSNCSKCGEVKPLQAHHHKGYAKEHRLDVQWLCLLCHRKADADERKIAGGLANGR